MIGEISKWLDVLKASAWQFAFLALACASILFGDSRNWLPVALDGSTKQAILIAAFAFTGLWFASIGSTLTKAFKRLGASRRRRRALKRHAQEFRDYIPHMSPESRAVFAQLLHENRKDFTTADDAGHAATLLGRGFVVHCVKRGQIVSLEDVPFRIPDHIWEVALQRKDEFPYRAGPDTPDAWRVDWRHR